METRGTRSSVFRYVLILKTKLKTFRFTNNSQYAKKELVSRDTPEFRPLGMGLYRKMKLPPGDSGEKTADLTLIQTCFTRCPQQDGTLSTDHYLCAAHELLNLFRPLGRGFRLALSELALALRILEIRRVSGAGCRCQRLGSLLDQEYERLNHNEKRRYASRSLWTVYSSLDFMLAVMQALVDAQHHDRPFKGQDKVHIYQKTLGFRQTTLTKTTVKTALTHSGGKKNLLRKLESNVQENASLNYELSHCIESALPVQKRVGELLGVLSFD